MRQISSIPTKEYPSKENPFNGKAALIRPHPRRPPLVTPRVTGLCSILRSALPRSNPRLHAAPSSLTAKHLHSRLYRPLLLPPLPLVRWFVHTQKKATKWFLVAQTDNIGTSSCLISPQLVNFPIHHSILTM
ncbi:hypothetical protein RIF29_15477 [Crotalaria pallida]|uniref:Uncharacterized protein n=1 Tax=Crotalaria pallida TaxID=3830 RepID=A0AAN9FD81_CROPI